MTPSIASRIAFVFVLSVCALSVSDDARACMHPPGAFSPRAVSQSGQHAIVLHDNGVEDLILKVDYATSEPLPSLGWVIPVPTAPSSYDTLAPGLFGDVDRFVGLTHEPLRRPRSRGRSGGRSSSAALRMLDAVSVGPYAIQPIQATGAAAASALGEWMEQNGFSPIAPSSLQYYVDREWTFLAIKISPADGEENLATEGGLAPLKITFATEQPVYPLKFSTHQGAFAARLTLITRDAIPLTSLETFPRRGFAVVQGSEFLRVPRENRRYRTRVHRFERDASPSALRSALQTRFGPTGALHLTVLYNKAVQGIAEWPEDLSVPWTDQRLQGGPSADATASPTASPTDAPNEASTSERADGPGTDEATPALMSAPPPGAHTAHEIERSSSCAMSAPSGEHVLHALAVIALLTQVRRKRSGRVRRDARR